MKEVDKISFLNQVIALLPDFISLDVRHWIACQFALESNFGTSGFALCNNNYCGMKVPAYRLTLALNYQEVGKFALFSGITSCVHDYLLWLQAQKFYRRELDNLDLLENISTFQAIVLTWVIWIKLTKFIIIIMSEQTKQTLIADAKGLAKWLSVDFSIKIFGVTLVEWHFPPKNN